MRTFHWIAVGSLLFVLGRADLSCKDENGKDVDWFIALKIPNLKGKEYEAHSPHIRWGTAFFYADANNQDFHISAKDINDPKSAIGYTMQQAIDNYKKKAKDTFTMFYNDQHPGTKTVGGRAHSKGVLSINGKQGFWVLHSAPRFVDPEKPYEYPGPQRTYGQSFICGTFTADQYAEISRQMIVAHFSIYAKSAIPADIASKTRFADVVTEKVTFRNTALKTKGGQWLRSYEKDSRYETDLYAGQIVPDHKKGMFVETWLNGQNPDWKNTCDPKLGVQNLRTISPGGVTWASSNDHSKWAVTKEPGNGLHRRCEPTAHRGGGTLCIENPKIWKFFRDAVKQVECCPSDKQECEKPPTDSLDVPLNLDPLGKQGGLKRVVALMMPKNKENSVVYSKQWNYLQ
ncbi:Plancitoxin-1 [Aphelenchoides fujianensis]|nr:Plancitoxin-1 [Aphelenchoides fujianensis]